LGDYSRYLSDEDFHIDENDVRSAEITVDVRMVATNEKEERVNTFSKEWTNEFGDKIRADAAGNLFFAFRTIAKPQLAKTGFSVERYTLQEWVDFEGWTSVVPLQSQRFYARSEFIPFVSIDAQRDIHQELNEKSSFVGRVLSQVKYDRDDVDILEKMISDINDEAVAKSRPLARLKDHLNSLNDSFGGGGSADVTPFPKKLRDLSKNFSIHFGNSAASSFSMEYHGMGTRSWASMLAVRAFTGLMEELHKAEAEPYHPIIAAEEPEAHLHPNAQRSLFSQLISATGQAIVSTHSPYLAAMCALPNLRSLSARGGHTQCFSLIDGLADEELKSLHRQVIRDKGEILFAKALILFEGQTEDQVVPAMFERWFGVTAFSKGINLASVNGRNYTPYLKLALSLGIPTVIVSDNDTKNGVSSKVEVDKQIAKIADETELDLKDHWFKLEYLTDSFDFEAELVNSCNLQAEIIDSFMIIKEGINKNTQFLCDQRAKLQEKTNDQLIQEMRNAKAKYSGFLADVLIENKNLKSRESIVPKALQNAFTTIEGWLN
jgi:putative ATP-dependent endonuclease of OLD family